MHFERRPRSEMRRALLTTRRSRRFVKGEGMAVGQSVQKAPGIWRIDRSIPGRQVIQEPVDRDEPFLVVIE
jgi:hypothetical protein